MARIEQSQKIIDGAEQLLTHNFTTMRDIFDYVMNLAPNNKAMIYHRINNSVREYTYTEYARLVKSTANKLSVLLNALNKDDVVALKFKNSPTWCILFWGILMAGFKILLIDAKLPGEDTKHLLLSARAKAIVGDEEHEYEHIINLKRDDIHSTNEDRSFRPRWADEVIFCSSGTTGDVKLLVYNGINLVHQLNAAKIMPKENLDIIYPNTDANPLRLIALIPFHHIFAFVSIFLWYNFYGSTLVFTAFNDPITLVKDIRDFKVTHIYHVPLFYEVVAKNFMSQLNASQQEAVKIIMDFNLERISRKDAGFFVLRKQRNIQNAIFGTQIRYCISGGGFLSQNVSETINGFGYPLYNGYGMTELGVTSVELSPSVKERVKRSIGHPLHGVEYKIKRTGELWVKCPMMHTYEIIKGKYIKTKLDKDGFFPTGDIATVENNKYYLKGRLKDMIITKNGENVYPDEVESYFKRVKGVNNLSVFQSHNKIVLVIYGNASTLEQLNNVNKNLPLHKQVNTIVFSREALPLSSSMKVKRFEVKKLYEKGYYKTKPRTLSADILAGYDEHRRKIVVDKLTKIFQKVLYTKKAIPGDAHWLNDLGSDSMTYITLISEIEKAFNYKVPIEKYGKLTCLNEFAKELLDSNIK